MKSPMRRIHKIRTKSTVKETISDEAIERMRDICETDRDLAMVDMLYSTGIRVGELVNLDIEDIDFEQRECIFFGKGDKERKELPYKFTICQGDDIVERLMLSVDSDRVNSIRN